MLFRSIAEANGRVPEVEYESARGILGLGRPTRKHPKRSAPVLEAACDRLVGLNPLPFSRIGYRAVSDVVQAIIEERSQKESNDFISKGGGKGSLLDILEDE